jgi:leucyl-tRNA synthetase
MGYNTAVSALMILTNAYDDAEAITKADYKLLLTLLNPMAPHITEELNEQLGYSPICEGSWPEYDESKTVETEREIGVQVNGKLRATIKVSVDEDEESLKEKALAEQNVKNFTDGHEIVKVIAIKGKIVNIVVK